MLKKCSWTWWRYSWFVLFILIGSRGFLVAGNIPDGCKEVVLNTLEFNEPVNLYFSTHTSFDPAPVIDFYSTMNLFNNDQKAMDAWREFLASGGYLLADKWTVSDKGSNFFKNATVGGYKGLRLPIAKRKFLSLKYVNSWKLNGQKAISFTFTYSLEPLISGLPKMGPWEGKGTCVTDPTTGRWKCIRQDPSYEGRLSILSDTIGIEYCPDTTRGICAYAKWIQKSSL